MKLVNDIYKIESKPFFQFRLIFICFLCRFKAVRRDGRALESLGCRLCGHEPVGGQLRRQRQTRSLAIRQPLQKGCQLLCPLPPLPYALCLGNVDVLEVDFLDLSPNR